jgi:hypothetical protein
MYLGSNINRNHIKNPKRNAKQEKHESCRYQRRTYLGSIINKNHMKKRNKMDAQQEKHENCTILMLFKGM